MSDILIKGIEMPTAEYGPMTITIYPNGNVREYIGDIGRAWDAIPVPPHGDLIDRDKASERFAKLAESIEAKLGYECSASYTFASLFLQNKEEFPTIIEKEENK